MDYTDIIFRLIRSIILMSNDEIDENEIAELVNKNLSPMALMNLSAPNSSIVIKENLQRVIATSRLLLNSIIKESEAIIKDVDKQKNILKVINKFNEKYPFYVDLNAPKQAINFFDSLAQDEYSFTDASQLIGLSRQTISTYVKNELNGFSKYAGKNKVTKESIYNYYVNHIIKKK
jgi:predicted DNA-binding protein YlxM (UPF0122 family)